jgi:hypothetical protein
MLTYALCMLYQSHDSIYRNTQWSPQQKGVLTDLLSEHDFKYVHISAHAVCSDICSRMPTYAYVCLLRCIWDARKSALCAAELF